MAFGPKARAPEANSGLADDSIEQSGVPRVAVLETITAGPFGHEHMADRAQILLWDHELRAVIAPYFAFRGLVVANPLWYPNLQPRTRQLMLNFVRTVLDTQVFDSERVNQYCEGPRR